MHIIKKHHAQYILCMMFNSNVLDISRLMCLMYLLAEIAVVKTGKALTVASLILSHLMNCVVDSVKVLSLSVLSDTHLVSICTSLCVHTLLKVSLGIPYHVAEELSKLSSMLSLFVSSLLPV